jgi:hypothetical protein
MKSLKKFQHWYVENSVNGGVPSAAEIYAFFEEEKTKPISVYCVLMGDRFDGDELKGVFKTAKAARRFIGDLPCPFSEGTNRWEWNECTGQWKNGANYIQIVVRTLK